MHMHKYGWICTLCICVDMFASGCVCACMHVYVMWMWMWMCMDVWCKDAANLGAVHSCVGWATFPPQLGVQLCKLDCGCGTLFPFDVATIDYR